MDNLKIIPLGGLGEVGMNCLVYEWKDEAVMVDCGVMFHDEDLGIDVIHPSFDYLIENPHKVKAVLLTHGHEDHVGAIPFLIQHLDVPVYGTPFVLKLVDLKLKNLPLIREVKMIPILEDSTLDIGPFHIQFAGVNHSIPQSLAVFIKTPAGNVLHTSDFKIGSPADPDVFERSKFESFRKQGIDLLLSDSTNVEREGLCGHEATVISCLREIIKAAPSRTFITLFPSNIRRVNAILNLVGELEKHVVLFGRSVEHYLGAAGSINLISTEELPIIPPSSMNKFDERDLVFLVTGTQGEPRSAMTKIARQEHKKIKIRKDDVFIFSSRHIPGNRMDIFRVMSDISRQGGRIFHSENTPGVHVSGHAHRGDLEEMLAIASPGSFIPIHGNYQYLAEHAHLAKSMKVENVLVIENGEAAEFSRRSGLSRSGRVSAGKVHVDGLIEVGMDILQTRKSISEGGVVCAVAMIASKRNEIVKPVNIVSHGVLDRERFSNIEQGVRERVQKKLDELSYSRKLQHATVKKEIKKSIEKFYSRYLGRHPFVIVEIVDVDT